MADAPTPPASGLSLTGPTKDHEPLTDFPPKAVKDLVEEVAALLKEKGESVGVVETAAGGLISASLLSVPGASGFYKGGLTLYTLESRIAFANWTPANLQTYRGPTPQIVTDLATSTLPQLNSTYILAESGTAGPTGGSTPNRTPGYVALAVVSKEGRVWTREINTGLGAERTANMWAFVREGVGLLRDVLRGEAQEDKGRGGGGENL